MVWREANPQLVKVMASVHELALAARKADRKAYMQEWANANKDKVNAKAARSRKKHPETGKAGVHNRRARKKGVGGTHTAAEVLALLKAQKSRCAYYQHCKTSIRAGYHKDHIVAIVNGGPNAIRNIQLLCQPCNARKHAKDPTIFAQSLGFLL